MKMQVIKRLARGLFFCVTVLLGNAAEQKQMIDYESVIRQLQLDLEKTPNLPNQKEILGLYLSLLRQYQANPNIELREKETGWTSLMFASYSGHTNVVSDLLSGGAKVNARGGDGETALTIATMAGHTDAVKMLLSAKADLYAEDQNGMTPFMLAVGFGRADIIKEFISAGVDVNIRQKSMASCH